jgi:hypothetical protein
MSHANRQKENVMIEVESDVLQHAMNITGLPFKRPAVDLKTIPPELLTAVRQYKHDTLYSNGEIYTDTVVAYDMEVVNNVFKQLLSQLSQAEPQTKVLPFEAIFPDYENRSLEELAQTVREKQSAKQSSTEKYLTRWFRRNK